MSCFTIILGIFAFMKYSLFPFPPLYSPSHPIINDIVIPTPTVFPWESSFPCDFSPLLCASLLLVKLIFPAIALSSGFSFSLCEFSTLAIGWRILAPRYAQAENNVSIMCYNATLVKFRIIQQAQPVLFRSHCFLRSLSPLYHHRPVFPETANLLTAFGFQFNYICELLFSSAALPLNIVL